MIKELPVIQEPTWLSNVDPATVSDIEFPLGDILRDSLYYPSSGFDGDPVRYLAGNVASFIYVDYGRSREELVGALRAPGFRGYELLAVRDVSEDELVPNGWTPSFPTPEDGDPWKYQRVMQTPFCLWGILQRQDGFSESHGPRRFSLLYLCADGVAAFQALYVANHASPRIVAVIQPGHGFGWNWTNFEDPNGFFARTVLQNPVGKPEILLFGGVGERHFYEKPCWPEYQEIVRFLTKSGHGNIGVWRRRQQQ